MTAHRGQLSPQLRSWGTLLLSGHTVPEAPETTREEVTGDHTKREEIIGQAFRELSEYNLNNGIWISNHCKMTQERQTE